jgi:hypothetical protein
MRRGKTDIAHFLPLLACFGPATIGESLFRYHWEAGASRLEWMRVFNMVNEEPNEEVSFESGL